MPRELLFSITVKDFDIQYFCAGGHGGQNMQKNATACRFVHKESGATGVSRDERSRLQNMKNAFLRCVDTDTFKKWHKVECARRMGRLVDMEEWVENQLTPEKIKVEGVDENGKWVDIRENEE